MTDHSQCAAAAHIAASSSPVQCDSDEAKMQRFLQWIAAQGATFSSAVRMDIGNRRLHAARPFQQGELILHIPKRLFLTREVVKESPIGKLIEQHGCGFGRYEYIAAFLCHLKREGGFWKPFIDILPQDFSGHPLFISGAEIEHLKGSWLYREIRERKDGNERFYNQLPPSVKEACTLAEFTWARCIVITRAFGVRFEGRPNVALIPLADMLDHSPHNQVRYVPESENGFTYAARGPIGAGEVLLTSYGNRSNGHLLCTYGFCVEDNPYNDAEILLQQLPDDHPFVEHVKKLGAPVDAMRAFKVRCSTTGDAADAMFSYLRLAHSDGSLRIGNAEVPLDGAGKIPPISRENEAAVLTALAEACERHLRGYDTSIEADDGLLKNPALPRNLRNMVMVRRDEKAILNYFLELTKVALPLLRDETCDVGKHTAACSEYAGYFAEIARCFEGKTACAAA